MSQTIEQAFLARLNAITELTTLLGANGLFKSYVPRTWDFSAKGAALTYKVPTKARGHALTGSDGTSVATIQIDVYGYTESVVKLAIEAAWNGIDGPPGTWGDGTCVIVSVVQQEGGDMDEPPVAKTDQVLYHEMDNYRIMYRVSLPTLN